MGVVASHRFYGKRQVLFAGGHVFSRVAGMDELMLLGLNL
jgi:prepilin-type processing-associated H-X9-DG protein